MTRGDHRLPQVLVKPEVFSIHIKWLKIRALDQVIRSVQRFRDDGLSGIWDIKFKILIVFKIKTLFKSKPVKSINTYLYILRITRVKLTGIEIFSFFHFIQDFSSHICTRHAAHLKVFSCIEFCRDKQVSILTCQNFFRGKIACFRLELDPKLPRTSKK